MDPQAFHAPQVGSVLRVPGKAYWAFYPAPLPPALEWTTELILTLSQADSALGELKGLAHNLANPHLLIAPFLRREAVLSSRIEGTEASLSDLYVYEAVQLPLLDRPGDVKEVYNYVTALEYGLERLQTLPISLRFIRELHAHLMKGVRGEHQTPGDFRRSQNWIGPPGCLLNSATFVPPPPPDMLEALYHLEAYLHAAPVLPPLIRLGLIHYQFEAIHPFLDGNGRVGRLLIVLLLCAWELLPQPLLYLSAYFQRHREAYYAHLMAVSQRGAWTAWLRFFLQGICTQAQDAIVRSRRLLALRESYREQFQNQRTAARLLRVIDYLFTRPIITIQGVAADLPEIDYQTASRYIYSLEADGVLREITERSRNRVYQADAIMQAITAPLLDHEEENL